MPHREWRVASDTVAYQQVAAVQLTQLRKKDWFELSHQWPVHPLLPTPQDHSCHHPCYHAMHDRSTEAHVRGHTGAPRALVTNSNE